MNGSKDPGAMPENVFVNTRPKVTAGLANEVDDVKKYAEPIQAATETGIHLSRLRWLSTPITVSNPAVAKTSPIKVPTDALECSEICMAGKLNMAFATIAPAAAPSSCEVAITANDESFSCLDTTWVSVTSGFR